MKNKKLLFALPLLCLGMALSSCGSSAPTEPQYQIYLKAKEAGYTGTYEEWLATIKGDKGDPGEDGKSAYELYCESHPDYKGTEEEWLDDLVNDRLGTKEKYTVTFNPNNGEESFTQEVENGKKITEPTEPTKQDYEFVGWYTEKDTLWSFEGYVVSENMTLTAKYNKAEVCTDGLVFSLVVYQGKPGYSVIGYNGTDTEVVIPHKLAGIDVVLINDEAFQYCSSLTSIIIPTGVATIGNSAFDECSSLTSIIIPNNLASIGDWAFDHCSSLTSIIIHNNVSSIGKYAFFGCSSLTIYCEAESKPEGWVNSWNYSNCPVVWGYKPGK